jgi:hypothetical protein
MNIKNLIVSVVVVFVFVFLFDWLFHGVLLDSIYKQTPNVWRTQTDMEAHFAWGILGELGTAIFASLIFILGFPTKNIPQGIIYGLLIGGLFALMNLGMYAYLPISLLLVSLWAVGALLQGLIIGLILGLVNKNTN